MLYFGIFGFSARVRCFGMGWLLSLDYVVG